tara:strand:+ start:42 stop:524 length:483 start_codon:yes stop_codon:yes gene_type:complete
MKLIKGLFIRFLQILAYYIPGATNVRVFIHRIRGVKIKNNVFIGHNVHIDNTCPNKVYIGNNTQLSVNVTVIAHFREVSANEKYSVYIDDDVFIGVGVIILPGVKIGRGSVISSGSVVSSSIPEKSFAIGNPAKRKGKVNNPLLISTSWMKFLSGLKPEN